MTKARYGSDEMVDVSLIICTRDRCQNLARCLRTVSQIVFEKSWELIVVDNGSTDQTAAVIREFAAIVSFPVTYVLEAGPGAGYGRNSGVCNSRGEILAFTDDDCYPARDFLEQIWLAFRDRSVGYITGRILHYDPLDYRVTINESNIPRTFPPRHYHHPGDLIGANMAFRRQVLAEIGGFDPLFGPGALFPSAEDLDVASRASASGWIGQYCPDVIVSHHHGRKSADVVGLLRSYDLGRGAYYMKLLLSGHEFSWFVRSVFGIRRRAKWYRRAVFWELIGAVKYIYVFLMQSLCSRLLSRRQ